MPYFNNFGQGGYYNQPQQQYGRPQQYGQQSVNYQRPPTAYQPQRAQPKGWGGGFSGGFGGFGGGFGGGYGGSTPTTRYGGGAQQNPFMQPFLQDPMAYDKLTTMRRNAGMEPIPFEAFRLMGSPLGQFLPSYNVPMGSYGGGNVPTGWGGYGGF